MKKSFFLVVTAMAAASVFALPRKAADITVAGYTGSSTLENFPVLVRISPERISGFAYADCAAGGADVAFTDAQGNALDREIDTWEPNGESLVWVRVPSFASNVVITMTYQDPSVTAQPACQTDGSVWTSAGYAGVWHMNEASGAVADASGHGLAATPAGNTANSIAAAGKVGTARQTATSAASGYLSVPNYNDLALGDTFTMSGWVYFTGISGYPRVFSRKKNYGDANGWEIEMKSGSYTAFTARGVANSKTVGGTIPTLQNSWVHLVFVYDGTALTAYANGKQVASGTIQAATDNGYPLSFGCDSDGSEAYVRGFFDECRLLGAAASGDWVKASYATQSSDAFLTYGRSYHLFSDDLLIIEAAPAEIGTPTPAYGQVLGLAANNARTLSMAATTVAGEGTVTNYLTGWKLESVDAETTMRTVIRSSSDANEVLDRCEYVHNGCAVFTWLWDVRDALGVGAPSLVSNGGNSLVLSADVAGIGYTAPSATLKFVYGASPDALAYTSVVSASVTGIGAVQGTLSRLTPGAVYYVKAVLETNDAARDAVESAVVAFQTEAVAEVAAPGLWQTFFTSANADWTKDIWSVPEGTDWRDYSDASRIRRRELTPIGAYTTLSQKYTSEIWGDQVYWPVNGGQWVYAGSIWLESTKSYKFRASIDDADRIVITDSGTGVEAVLISDTTYSTADTSAAYSPSVTGWHYIEIRLSDGTGGAGGTSNASSYKNTTNLGFSQDGGTTWALLKDPGDGSLLRAPDSKSGSAITATENIAAGALASVSLAFASVDSARALCAAWGPAYGGENPADWYATNAIATVAAGATSATWTPPADWGSDSNLVVRFYFDGDSVKWSNAIFWHDYSAPSVTDVAANGRGGDTLVVSGTLAAFPGAACTLSVYTGDSPTTLTNVWTGLAGNVLTAPGDFSFTLFEPDTASPRYFAPGSTPYVAIEAVSDGKVSRTAPVLVPTLSAPATFAATPTAAVARRTATFSGRLATLGMGNAANVSVWYGTANNATSFVPLAGATADVTDTEAFSIVGDFPAVSSTYYWQLRAVNTASGGTAVATNVSAVVTSSTQDNTVYTWQAKNGDWNGDWTDPGHWAASPAADAFGYPASAAATAAFPIGHAIEVTLDAATTIGTLDLSAYDMTDTSRVLDVTFKGAAGENGGTNKVLTVSSDFAARAPGGAFTLDNAALRIDYTATHELINSRLFRLQNGAYFYTKGNVSVYDGARIELAGESDASINAFYIGGKDAALVLDDSRLELRGESHFSSKSTGGTILFRGAHPLLYVKNNSNTLFFNANNASEMVFEVPAGGFAEPVLQCTASMAVNDLFRQNDKTTAKLTLSVPDDAPFYSQAGTLTQPLIAWSGSKAIATANLVFADLPDGGSFLLGTAAAEDYGFAAVADFSGTAKALGVSLVSVAHDGRLTVATDAPVPLDGYAPALGVTDGLSGAVTLSAPTDVVSNGVHYVCTGYTLVEYAAGAAATPTATNTVADGTASFSYAMPAGRAEITWHYAADYPVTAAAVNDAGGSVALSSPYMASGKPVTLTASTVTEGMEFQYWYGDLPYAQRYQNPIVLEADKAASVTAFFGATKENGGVRRAVWYDNRRNWYDTAVWSGGVIAGTNDTAVVVSTRKADNSSNSKGWIVAPSFFAVHDLIVSNAMVQVATDTGGTRDSSADQVGFYYYGNTASSDTARREPVGFDVSGDVTIRRGGTTDVRNGGAIYVGGSQQRCFSQVNIGGNLNIEHGGMQVAAGYPFDFYLDSAKAIDGPSGFIAFPYEEELFRGSNFLKVGGNLTLAPSTSSVRNILQVANDFRTGSAVWLDVAGDVTVGAGSTVTAWRGGYGKFNASGTASGNSYSMCPGGHGTGDNTSGGSHGGLGGSETTNPGYQKPTSHVGVYGYEFFPIHPGSPNSGNGGIDSRGGGSIRLDCATLNLDGGLIANGHNAGGNKGAGAGGSILVICDVMNFGADCAVKAEGGAPNGDNAGAGGGRIALCEGLTPEQVASLHDTKAVPDDVTASPLADKLGARASAAARVGTTLRSCGFDGTAWYLVNTAGKKTLTIAGDPSNLGAPTPGYGPQIYDDGEEIAIAAPDDAFITADNRTKRICTGYTVTDTATGAVIADSDKTSDTITVAGDWTLTWKLTTVRHLVDVACATTGGTITTNAVGAAGEAWQSGGSTFTVTAVPESGFRFAGWTGEIAEADQYDATASETLAAGWRIRAVFVSDTAETATWTGEGDGSDWCDAANWSTGKVPGPRTAVVVGAGATVSTSAGLVFHVASLTVEAGASVSFLPEGSYWTYAASHDPHKTQEDIVLYDWHDCGVVASGSITVAGTLVAGNRSSAADAKVVAGGDLAIAEGASVTIYGGFNDALVNSRDPSVWRNYGAIASAGGAMTVDGTLALRGDAVSGSPTQVTADTLRVGASGSVNADSGGFGWRTFGGINTCYAPGGMSGNNYTGGAYGGWGGGYNTPAGYGNKRTYGDPLRPFMAGSNGGHGDGYLQDGKSNGRRGGGALRVEVKGNIRNDGRISANGASLGTGAGAGGSLWISCARYRTGADSVTSADGGSTGSGNGGSGGGGRVLVCERLSAEQIEALYATGEVPRGSITAFEVTAENASQFVRGTISAAGGINTQTNPYFSGTDGTVRWIRGPEAGTMLILQ